MPFQSCIQLKRSGGKSRLISLAPVWISVAILCICLFARACCRLDPGKADSLLLLRRPSKGSGFSSGWCSGDPSCPYRRMALALRGHERVSRNVASLAAMTFSDIEWRDQDFLIMGHPMRIRDNARAHSPKVIADELAWDEYGILRLPRLLGAGDVILDLGTNVGMTAILLARCFPDAHVIGIEPSPANYAAAVHNIRENGVADRVTLVLGALSSAGGTIEMLYTPDNTGQSSAYIREKPVIKDSVTSNANANATAAGDPPSSSSSSSLTPFTIETITFPELMAMFNLWDATIPFIKLDCEGCEYDIIPSLPPEALEIFTKSHLAGETHPLEWLDERTIPMKARYDVKALFEKDKKGAMQVTYREA